nr:hypothetical protein KitaXyl93_60430 [Kitasatospora sp. Xyl93]
MRALRAVAGSVPLRHRRGVVVGMPFTSGPRGSGYDSRVRPRMRAGEGTMSGSDEAGAGSGPGSGAAGQDGEGYAGLRIERARELARRHGWATVRVLEPGDLMTMEYRQGRLNLAVRDGVVERSWEG